MSTFVYSVVFVSVCIASHTIVDHQYVCYIKRNYHKDECLRLETKVIVMYHYVIASRTYLICDITNIRSQY